MSGVQVKTRANGEITLQEDTVRKFNESLRGELILSDNAGYDDARSVWNAMIDRRPALIARCLGVADVVTCVNFAREHGLIMSIKGGGHNISGLAVCDGGLVLDMSRMRGVWVDPTARIARAQAGCLLGDVDRETQLHGLAAVLGFISNTGIAGLTLRRRIRLPYASVWLDQRQSPIDGGGHRGRTRPAREREGKPRSVLGPLRRRRQLRSRNRLRV